MTTPCVNLWIFLDCALTNPKPSFVGLEQHKVDIRLDDRLKMLLKLLVMCDVVFVVCSCFKHVTIVLPRVLSGVLGSPCGLMRNNLSD